MVPKPARKPKKPLETTLGKACTLPKDRKDVDLSHIRKPIDTSLFGLRQVLSLFQTATEEVKNYITFECDLMYECRICRTIFRSLANFILHKRNYCHERFNPLGFPEDDDNEESSIIINSSNSSDSTAVFEKAAEPHGISTIVEKLKERHEIVELNHRTINEDLSEKKDEVNIVRGPKKVPAKDVLLENIPTTSAAMFQTVLSDVTAELAKSKEFMRTEVMEIHSILDDNEAVLDSSGKVCKFETNKIAKIPKGNLFCTECDITFSTKKTLGYHLKYQHNNTQLVYICPDCKDTFANAWGVYRHLMKVHRKTSLQIRRLRQQIHNSVIRRDECPVKKKGKECAPAKIEETDEENQWLNNVEDNYFQMCGGCGKRFERKAALHSHAVMCAKRMAVCNTIKENQRKKEGEEARGRTSKTEKARKEEEAPKGASKRKPQHLRTYKTKTVPANNSDLNVCDENANGESGTKCCVNNDTDTENIVETGVPDDEVVASTSTAAVEENMTAMDSGTDACKPSLSREDITVMSPLLLETNQIDESISDNTHQEEISIGNTLQNEECSVPKTEVVSDSVSLATDELYSTSNDDNAAEDLVSVTAVDEKFGAAVTNDDGNIISESTVVVSDLSLDKEQSSTLKNENEDSSTMTASEDPQCDVLTNLDVTQLSIKRDDILNIIGVVHNDIGELKGFEKVEKSCYKVDVDGISWEEGTIATADSENSANTCKELVVLVNLPQGATKDKFEEIKDPEKMFASSDKIQPTVDNNEMKEDTPSPKKKNPSGHRSKVMEVPMNSSVASQLEVQMNSEDTNYELARNTRHSPSLSAGTRSKVLRRNSRIYIEDEHGAATQKRSDVILQNKKPPSSPVADRNKNEISPKSLKSLNRSPRARKLRTDSSESFDKIIDQFIDDMRSKSPVTVNQLPEEEQVNTTEVSNPEINVDKSKQNEDTTGNNVEDLEDINSFAVPESKSLKRKREHKTPERKVKPLKLDLRPKVYKKDVGFIQQVVPYMDQQKLQCLSCKTEFPKLSKLVKHMSAHLSWFRFQCSRCAFVSFSKSDCVAHATEQHSISSEVVSSVVLPIPNWKSLLLSHEFRELGEQNEVTGKHVDEVLLDNTEDVIVIGDSDDVEEMTDLFTNNDHRTNEKPAASSSSNHSDYFVLSPNPTIDVVDEGEETFQVEVPDEIYSCEMEALNIVDQDYVAERGAMDSSGGSDGISDLLNFSEDTNEMFADMFQPPIVTSPVKNQRSPDDDEKSLSPKAGRKNKGLRLDVDELECQLGHFLVDVKTD